jgi:hypothetical protein
MSKKLPGEEVNPLFLGTLKHFEENKHLKKVNPRKAHSKTLTAKHKINNAMQREEN